jgi:hypothetical protein
VDSDIPYVGGTLYILHVILRASPIWYAKRLITNVRYSVRHKVNCATLEFPDTNIDRFGQKY